MYLKKEVFLWSVILKNLKLHLNHLFYKLKFNYYATI